MPPEVAVALDAVAKLGALGLALLAIYGFLSGRVRVGSLVDKATDELKGDRDDWKALAQDATPELKRLNDLLDTAVKLLLDPARRPPTP